MIKPEGTWNHVQLERPPNARCCVETSKFDSHTFLASLDKVIKELENQETLHMEAAVLSRLIYRMKCKFRNDKGLKTMSKVNKALLNYLSLSLDKEYKILKSYTDIEEEYTHLPSKQMVEYVLVRTQGFAKLMSRLEEVARHSAHFFKNRMSIGHAWSISIVAYAVISRIWILSRYLIQKCCIWYSNLYQYLKRLKTVGVEWLPNNYELPDNLKSWLALPWIDEAIPSVPSNQQLKDTMFKLIIPQECDLDLDISLDTKRQDTEPETVSALLHQKEKNVSDRVPNDNTECIISVDDTGEVISRHKFNVKHTDRKDNTLARSKKHKHSETISQEEKTTTIACTERVDEKREQRVVGTKGNKKKERKQHGLVGKSNNSMNELSTRKALTFDNVTTKSDLMTILSKDSYPGLDKLQWNMIRNKSKKLINELDARSDDKKQSTLLRKTIQRIRHWIT